MKKIVLVALMCLGGGQNVYAEVLDLRESGESGFDLRKSSESNGESFGESVLDSGESSGKSTESNAKSTTNKSVLWQSSAFEKTGGFLGFEYGLGLVRAHIGEGADAVQSDYLSAYINVIFGYQWYFLDADWAHLGLRVGGSLGYSSYGFKDKFVLSSEDDKRLEVEAHNVRYGADLAFVWDFLDSYIHALGIFIAPLGFEGNTIRGRLKERVGETTTKHKIATTTKIAYKLTAGAQYMFKRHHLLFAAYRLLYSDGKIPQGVISIYGGNGSVSMRHSGFVGYAYKF